MTHCCVNSMANYNQLARNTSSKVCNKNNCFDSNVWQGNGHIKGHLVPPTTYAAFVCTQCVIFMNIMLCTTVWLAYFTQILHTNLPRALQWIWIEAHIDRFFCSITVHCSMCVVQHPANLAALTVAQLKVGQTNYIWLLLSAVSGSLYCCDMDI